jgi:hypothetical protein
MRRGAGVLVLLFGVYTLTTPGGHAGHGGKHAAASVPASGHAAHAPE